MAPINDGLAAARDGSFGGGGNGPITASTPKAPVGVKIRVIGINSILVEWRDVRFLRGGLNNDSSPNPVESWGIVVASDKTLSTDSSDPTFGKSVLAAGKIINTFLSNGDGKLYSYEFTLTTILSGWVVVLGYGFNGLPGPTSTPVHVDLSGNTLVTPPPDGTLISDGINFTAINNNVLFELQIVMKPPADLSLFGGWHPHLSGYNGIAQYIELGSPQFYNGSTANSVINTLFPIEGGQGNGNATFSGVNVTRVSGDNFSAAWVGRHIYVLSVSTGRLSSTTVATFVNVNSMTTTATLLAGTWNYRVLNALTIRIPSISKTNGYRDPNVAHAGVPTINL